MSEAWLKAVRNAQHWPVSKATRNTKKRFIISSFLKSVCCLACESQRSTYAYTLIYRHTSVLSKGQVTNRCSLGWIWNVGIGGWRADSVFAMRTWWSLKRNNVCTKRSTTYYYSDHFKWFQRGGVKVTVERSLVRSWILAGQWRGWGWEGVDSMHLYHQCSSKDALFKCMKRKHRQNPAGGEAWSFLLTDMADEGSPHTLAGGQASKWRWHPPGYEEGTTRSSFIDIPHAAWPSAAPSRSVHAPLRGLRRGHPGWCSPLCQTWQHSWAA